MATTAWVNEIDETRLFREIVDALDDGLSHGLRLPVSGDWIANRHIVMVQPTTTPKPGIVSGDEYQVDAICVVTTHGEAVYSDPADMAAIRAWLEARS